MSSATTRIGLIALFALTLLLAPSVVSAASLEQNQPPNEVQVELVSYEIRMPQTLPPGPTEFVVANIGDVPHNFEIEGQGIERVFDQDLQPGERETMQVELEPGEYEVYCPVGNHAEMGMRLTLRVSEEAQQQAEPTPAPEEETADVSATPTVTDTAEITDTAEGAPGTPITATAGITDTAMVTGTGVMTEAVVLRAGDRAITQQEFEQMFLDTLRSFTARTGLPVNVLTLPLFEELRTRYLA